MNKHKIGNMFLRKNAKHPYEQILFLSLLLIGLLPLIMTKYYLTLDGPGHIYNGNIIKELILGNHQEFANLFRLNNLPVPNWISHFLFAIFNLVFPDYLSEKLVLGIYLVLFPLFFRKIVLWFKPQNYILSYFGILFAHNHLLYLGSYNLIYALVFFFITIYFILRYSNQLNYKNIAILGILFLLVYFSHMLIFMITIVVTILMPLSILKSEKKENKITLSNWPLFFIKLRVVFISMVPALILGIIYLAKVDSLEEAGRLGLGKLINWLVDIRPLLTLSTSKPWNIFTHVLFGIFVLMMIVQITTFIKENCILKNKQLFVSLPAPGFNLIWFLLFIGTTFLYLVVPNANILPERLIILVFIFFGFWLATQDHKKWVQFLFLTVLIVTHITFSILLHGKNMRNSSKQIEQMNEITRYIEPGSLLLPFNYAYQHNWLHMHSPGYFGSDKPVAVIENYEGQLRWFPVNWNLNGPYQLDPINVWAADNKKMVEHFFTTPENHHIFSLPLKSGTRNPIPYVAIFGTVKDKQNENYEEIIAVLDNGYDMLFENDFCKLYQIRNQ